jgi:molybdate transport system permease protein
MTRARSFWALGWAALAVVVAFLALPVAAVFTKAGPGQLVQALGEPAARDALWLSLRTTLAATALIVLVGTPAAYLLGTRRFRARGLVLTLIELPLVIPPAVAGIALLAAFGPRGIGGPALSHAGVELAFQTAGVIAALTFVAAPFFLRQAVAAFSAVPTNLIEAARTHGATPARAFFTVAVPCAREGLVSGVALAWARALGEFGATLLFAGSLQGVTRTAPLQIFADFNRPGGFTAAMALSAVLILISALILAALKLLGEGRPERGLP